MDQGGIIDTQCYKEYKKTDGHLSTAPCGQLLQIIYQQRYNHRKDIKRVIKALTTLHSYPVHIIFIGSAPFHALHLLLILSSSSIGHDGANDFPAQRQIAVGARLLRGRGGIAVFCIRSPSLFLQRSAHTDAVSRSFAFP